MRQKADPVKFCETCGTQLARKRFNGRLEDRTRFLSRKHRGERCETCGTTEGLHAHHRDENPANNDPANIATLCGSCHLKWHWREGKRSQHSATAFTSTSAGCSEKR